MGNARPIATTANRLASLASAAGLSGPVSVLRYGADATGATTSTAAFQAAVDSVASGAAVEILVPPGIYNLATNVTQNGRFVSWRVMAGASFTGAGVLPFPYTANAGDRGAKNSFIAVQRGTAASPGTDLSPLIHAYKITAGTATSERNSTAVFGLERRTVTTSGTRAEALFAEALDYAGGSGTFVEGGRFHGVLMTGATDGAAYGGISIAGAEASVAWKYLVGHEAVVNNSTTDAPVPASFDKNHYCAAYVATSDLGGTKKVDVGFITNPFTTANEVFRTGFMVAEDSVDTAAFVNRASLATGLDLSMGSYSNAAIYLKNNTAIRVRNNADSSALNMFYVDTSDQLQLATNATRTVIVSSLLMGGSVTTVASATGTAGLNLPHGTAPTSPVNGDIWTTTAGLYVRINGATVGPLS